jgi:hypothetical protein
LLAPPLATAPRVERYPAAPEGVIAVDALAFEEDA